MASFRPFAVMQRVARVAGLSATDDSCFEFTVMHPFRGTE